MSLAGRTIIMSGGSRGIGLAIALRAAEDGANLVLLAKTAKEDPRLKGTIYSAAEQIEAAGGQALPVVGDVRNDDDIARAVSEGVARFGGIDAVVNNASVLFLAPTLEITPKQYDLMQDVGVRGSFMLARAALPHLLESDNPHILTLSPPLNMNPAWLGRHPGYLLEKYGMSLLTLGLSAEFADRGVAVNGLWPRTTIATDAVGNLLGGAEMIARSRSPRIMADAAHVILSGPARERTGQLLIDDEVLAASGVSDFSEYGSGEPGVDLELDLFLD